MGKVFICEFAENYGWPTADEVGLTESVQNGILALDVSGKVRAPFENIRTLLGRAGTAFGGGWDLLEQPSSACIETILDEPSRIHLECCVKRAVDGMSVTPRWVLRVPAEVVPHRPHDSASLICWLCVQPQPNRPPEVGGLSPDSRESYARAGSETLVRTISRRRRAGSRSGPACGWQAVDVDGVPPGAGRLPEAKRSSR